MTLRILSYRGDDLRGPGRQNVYPRLPLSSLSRDPPVPKSAYGSCCRSSPPPNAPALARSARVLRHLRAAGNRLRHWAGEVHSWQSSPPSGFARTGGAFRCALRAAHVSGSALQRVVLFLDYQNVYHRARDTFSSPSAAAGEGQIDPLDLGHLLARRVPGGRLEGVRVYRGRPSRRRDARSYAAYRRQTATQVNLGRGLVTMISTCAIHQTGRRDPLKRRAST